MDQRRELETAIIRSITANPEATMSQVASNSIAIAVLRLKAIYLGATPSQEDIDKQYADCATTMRNIRATDLFKPDEETAGALSSSIDFILKKADENTSHLDIVTLYLLGEDGHYHEQTLELPLKVVLPLLVRASMDDAKFAHQYKGTAEEQLEQARTEKPMRLLSLFRCFQRARAGLCHQGVRNELVLLLNNVYEDIHLIEDTAATVAYFLKETIAARFNHYYRDIVLGSHEERTFLNKLFTWMKERDPSALLTIIDPEHIIKRELLAYFVQHGSNPDTLTIQEGDRHISLSDYIDLMSSRLDFAPNKEHPVLHMLNILLNADTIGIMSHEQKNALTTMQAWIQSTFTLSPAHTTTITDVYLAYQASQQLTQYTLLLTFTGRMTTDEIKQLKQSFNEYYQSIADASDPLPRPSVQVLQTIESLNLVVQQCKKDNLYTEIENFFARWISAINQADDDDYDDDDYTVSVSMKKLYALLLDKYSLSKILLKDTDIQAFNKRNTITDGERAFRDITPYEINRVFLHAMLTSPLQWTPLFETTYREVLSFVKHNLKEHHLETSLKRTSYPRQLISQLDYLRDLRAYLATSDTLDAQATMPKPMRPPFVLPLPNSIETPEEWIFLSMLVDEDKRLAIYQSMQQYLLRMLAASIQSYGQLLEVFASVPRNAYKTLFLALRSETIQKIFKKPKNLTHFLAQVPITEYPTYINTLGDELINTSILSPRFLCAFIESLSEENLDALFDALGSEKINKAIQSPFFLPELLYLSTKNGILIIDKIISRSHRTLDHEKYILISARLTYLMDQVNSAHLFKKSLVTAGINTKENLNAYLILDDASSSILHDLVSWSFTNQMMQILPHDHQSSYNLLLRAVEFMDELKDRVKDLRNFYFVFNCLLTAGLLSADTLRIVRNHPEDIYHRIAALLEELDDSHVTKEEVICCIISNRDKLSSILEAARAPKKTPAPLIGDVSIQSERRFFSYETAPAPTQPVTLNISPYEQQMRLIRGGIVKKLTRYKSSYPDFEFSCKKMLALISTLQQDRQITMTQYDDLMEKIEALVDDPKRYKTFLATAKSYHSVAGGKLTAHIMRVCGWAAKIICLHERGDALIKNANKKLDQIELVEQIAASSERIKKPSVS